MSQDLLVKDTGVIARAELDTQISTAKAYPRDAKRAIEYATQLATMDEETAQSCFYCLPRKDKDGVKKEIKGGSIRLAEIVANAWGNIHAATRIVENDGVHVTSEGVAWDLETNVKITMQNKVSIQFKDKSGKYYTANADMQTVLSNAVSAKALRNAIFKVVPKALVDRVLEKAMTFSVGDQKTMSSKRQELFDKLIKMGVDKQKILDYYGKQSINDFTAEDLKSLIGVGNAIKDKMISPDEVFAAEGEEENKSASAADRVNNLIQQKKSITQKVNPETGEIINLFEQIKKQIQNSKSMDTLSIAADLIREVEPEKQEELNKLYKQKQSEVKT